MTQKITQIVLYKLNPKNPDAEIHFVNTAKKLLGNIEGVELTIGKSRESDRAVNISNGTITKMTTFDSEKAMENYFSSQGIKDWCAFVLKGWMLEDSTASNPEEEFIEHILSGKNEVNWIHNPNIPENEIIWAGERIVIFDHL